MHLNIWLIIALPLFVILAWGYWYLVAKPWRMIDTMVIVASFAVALASDAWVALVTDSGHIWRQIIGFTVAYGAFATVMGLALWWRRRS